MLFTVRISNPKDIHEAYFVDDLSWEQAVALASVAKRSYTAILDNGERDHEHNGYDYWTESMSWLGDAMPWIFG